MNGNRLIRIPLKSTTDYVILNPATTRQILVRQNRIVYIDFKDGTKCDYVIEEGKDIEIITDVEYEGWGKDKKER